ncbi:MAG: hypothetical protein H7838_11395 [Magnetococcus sp. DMHC-8]
MNQHSFSIPNESGAAFRADVNAALQALATQSIGASAPPVTYPNMIWADTTNFVVWQRNQDNSAWLCIGTLDVNKCPRLTSVTSLATRDFGKTLLCSGTWQLTLPSPSAVGNGWWCRVKMVGSGTVTMTPPSGTIDGESSKALFVINQECTIVTDGVDFFLASTDFLLNLPGSAGQVLTSNGPGQIPTMQSLAVKNVQADYAWCRDVVSTTAILPCDNTTPGSSEGAELLRVSMTPVAAGSQFFVFWNTYLSSSRDSVAALFLNNSFLNAAMASSSASGFVTGVSGSYRHHAGDTANHTFTLRFGPALSGTAYAGRNSPGNITLSDDGPGSPPTGFISMLSVFNYLD